VSSNVIIILLQQTEVGHIYSLYNNVTQVLLLRRYERKYTVFQKSDAKIQITITTAYILSELNILLAALIIVFST